MLSNERPGTVYWIDHYVVCTNDIARWEAFHTELLGAKTVGRPVANGVPVGIFQTVARCRNGGFISKAPLPPTRGLAKGLPRYGLYIFAADIDAHLRRLDRVGAPHSDPSRTSALGENGTTVRWQDPDGNQFEFWAPDVLPEGAMEGCGPERVGRISHAVLESRDLDRTAAFFGRYCALDPQKSADIPSDTLVFPLAAGGRLVFQHVTELQGRTTGCGLPDTHTSLLLRDEDYFVSYARLWAELPELDHDVLTGPASENPEKLPACTILHPSSAGRKFKQLTRRGDDWFDWDTNLFHFYGGTPVGGSLAIYEGHSIQHYIEQWQKTHGNIDSLASASASLG
jgi:predicted enzyme related to lactoylglutathione lyase